MIDQYQYLALMGGCLLVTLPLEFVFGARVYRRARGLFWALLPVVVVFSVWDILGIVRGHWSYNPRFVTGLQLGLGMPVEELVFFIVVPICGLLSYEAVGRVLHLVRNRGGSGAGSRPRVSRPRVSRPRNSRSGVGGSPRG